MGLLCECVDSLLNSEEPASLQSLYYEYDKRMIEYGRQKASDKGFDSPRSRAQQTIDLLVSEMLCHDFTADQMARYRDLTSTPDATWDVVAEHCELNLTEFRLKKRKSTKRTENNGSGRNCRRSKRVMEKERRKQAMGKKRGPLPK